MRTVAGASWVFIASFLLILPAESVSAASPPGNPHVKALAASGLTVEVHRKTGQAVFVGTDHSGPLSLQAITGSGENGNPAAYLLALGPSFGLKSAFAQTRLARDRKDELGLRSVRYTQTHNGVPVIAGDVIVNLDASGRLLSMIGRAAPDLTVSTVPTVGAATAATAAIAKVAKSRALDADSLVASDPELWIYDPRLLDGGDDFPAGLVWRTEVKARTLEPIRYFVLVDARNGAIRRDFNQVHEARNRKTYDLNHGATLPGTLLCDESNTTCAGMITDAVSAHLNARDTYDYYFTQHGRDSIDGAGMALISTVRYCPDLTAANCPYQNAFWNSTQMVYGDNFAVGDDVVAHELTHGVTEHESGLFYSYQSGAINESFSDVFGEFVDQMNGRGNDSAAVKWLIGEDLSIGAIRNMADPTAFGDPDRMTSANYYLGTGDNGGVHFNSGVNNKAAFLIADGATFNGRTMAGLGLVKTGKIYYRVQTAYLGSGSDYFDLYNALFQACLDLVGTAGITAADCKTVRDATEATEMNLEPSVGFSTDAAMCPAGQSVGTGLFVENVEGSVSRWGVTTTNSLYQWGLTTGYATSGDWSFYAYDAPATADQILGMNASVVVPSAAHLRFRHAFQFESTGSSFYDGGVLEYSINAGAGWVDANALRSAGPGYSGAVSTLYGNPLGGRSAFVAQSHGYVATRYDLSSLAGQAVRFRWRVGTDSSISALGWFVDDVSIHTCVTSALVQITSAASVNFPRAVPSSFTFTATGNPTPTIRVVGALPAGVSVVGNNITGSAATEGTYPLVVTASNGIPPDAVQFFTLNVVFSRTAQVISFPPLPATRPFAAGAFTVSPYGGASGNPVVLTSSTPATCLISGFTIAPQASGLCTMIATQAGNASYADALPVTQNIYFTIPGKKRVDFNRDGKADILWQNAPGRTALWLMDGATQTGGRTLFDASTGWYPKFVADFSGDGFADIVFEHPDGRSAMWLMIGDVQEGGAQLLEAGTGWTAKVVGDFDGDGRADIVWEHTDGRVAMWTMAGTSMQYGALLLPAGTGWHPKLVADFNNDGRSDILWEHNDGSSALWIMHGTVQVGGGRLFPGGTGWTSTAVGDLNGDGMDDILWTHTDGRVAAWTMNGATQTSGVVLIGAATGYSVVGMRDINGDGKADIAWRRASDGFTSYWLMNGTAQIGGGTLLAPGSGYTMKRLVDFSGDNRADFLAQHSDGTVVVGIWNGATFVISGILPAGTGYVPVIVPE